MGCMLARPGKEDTVSAELSCIGKAVPDNLGQWLKPADCNLLPIRHQQNGSAQLGLGSAKRKCPAGDTGRSVVSRQCQPFAEQQHHEQAKHSLLASRHWALHFATFDMGGLRPQPLSGC